MSTIEDAEHWYNLAERISDLYDELQAQGVDYRDDYPLSVLIDHVRALGDTAVLTAYKAQR